MTDAVVWITGATGGLGCETALMCAARGAALALSGRSEPSLQTLAAECERAGASGVVIHAFDVCDFTALGNAARAIHTAYKRIDGFVATAADVPLGSLDTFSVTDWEYGLRNKLLATMECLRLVVPVMRAQHGGRIVALSGARGTEPSPHSLLPGAVNAAMTRRLERYLQAGAEITGNTVEAMRTEMLRDSPSGRVLEPAEIAIVVCELLFEFPVSFTGQTVLIDGGESRGVR